MGSSSKALLLALLLAQKANKRAMTPGPAGDAGLDGIGTKGDQGPRGERGAAGKDGDRGQQGERGLRGKTGMQGERGPQGLRGEQGERGQQGERGEKGDKGQRGARGERGERGEKGDTGAAGKPGIVWRGMWNIDEEYQPGDAVHANGSAWVATKRNKGDFPPLFLGEWDALALKGQDGIGPSGGTLMVVGPIEISPGATATIDIGEEHAATWRLSYNVSAGFYVETIQANGDTSYTVHAKLGGMLQRAITITQSGGLVLSVTNNEAATMYVRATRF